MAVWGKVNVGVTGQALTSCVYIELDNFPENGNLSLISYYLLSGTPTVRIALYVGGSAGNPNRATLVEDLGTLAAGTVPGAQSKSSITTPALTAGLKYWICLKSNDAGSLVYNATDDDNLTGIRITSTGESADETDAWDAVVPGAGSSANRRITAHLVYTTGGSITDVDGDNTVLNAQASVVINTSGITTAGATVNLKVDDDSISVAQAVASTTANSITLTSISLGNNPFTASGRQLQIEVNDGTNYEKNVTVNPATGKSKAVIDAAPVVALVNGYITSVLYGYTGTAPAIGHQIEYDTVDSAGNAITMANGSGGIDGTFSIAGQQSPTTFAVRWWNPTDYWSNSATVTVSNGVIIAAVPNQSHDHGRGRAVRSRR